METKLKHLEFIQNVITRMANNSFLLKGWSITVVSSLIAFSVSSESNHKYIWIALFVSIVFWALDAYFLRQERLFRHLYDEVRKKSTEKSIDFSMDTRIFVKRPNVHPCRVLFSETLRMLHLEAIVASIIILIVFFYIEPFILLFRH